MDFQVCQPQKTRVLCHLKKEKSISMDSRCVDLNNTGLSTTLIWNLHQQHKCKVTNQVDLKSTIQRNQLLREAGVGWEWWTGTHLNELSTVWGPHKLGAQDKLLLLPPPPPHQRHCTHVNSSYILNETCKLIHIHGTILSNGTNLLAINEV